MSASSRRIDRLQATFDHGGLVANAGLVVPATLMVRLGLEALIDAWVRTGSARPGRKILTLVAAMIAGATHIDHVNMLRAGATRRVLPFKVMAPSTIGSFLRSFTFGHIRQLDAVHVPDARLGPGSLGAGPGDRPLVIDLDSTICEVHGKQKQAASYGYTRRLGYHPLLATRAGTGEVLFARMRKGSANTARGVIRFVDELAANLARAGATGPMTVRADSGFWSWKLCDRLDAHGIAWSITVRLHKNMKTAIAGIDDDAWVDIDYPDAGQAQVAETTYTAGRGKKQRTVRPRRATHPPDRTQHNGVCGPTGATTPSSPPTQRPRRLTPTGSTANTPSSNSPSETSKKAPASNTSPPGTTTQTPPGSPAPCSLTTSAAGPPCSPTTHPSPTAPDEHD